MTSEVDRTQLKNEVSQTIIESLNLLHLKADQITLETPLMGGGLDLDSVDILELVVAFEQKYSVSIPDSETGKKVFENIGSLVEFIAAQKKN